MRIIRTIIWTVLVLVLLVFSWANWDTRVAIVIWEDLVLDTNVPALAITSFLLGLLPVWLLLRGTRWQLRRRINSLETAVRSAVGPKKNEDPLPGITDPGPPQI